MHAALKIVHWANYLQSVFATFIVIITCSVVTEDHCSIFSPRSPPPAPLQVWGVMAINISHLQRAFHFKQPLSRPKCLTNYFMFMFLNISAINVWEWLVLNLYFTKASLYLIFICRTIQNSQSPALSHIKCHSLAANLPERLVMWSTCKGV